MTTKLRVKIGELELEYEGTEEFVSSGLMPLIEALNKVSVTVAPTRENKSSGTHHVKKEEGAGHHPTNTSTSTIAQKLKVKKGPSLVLAAVARIVLVNREASAERSEILREMKTATAYYKDSYAGNLTSHLQTLVTSGKLNDLGSNRYSLHAEAREQLERMLAEQ
jgi:hypothetical protein